MADNVASEVARFLKSEGRQQLRGIASGIISETVSDGASRRKTGGPVAARTNLAGLTAGGFTLPVRAVSGMYQKQLSFAGSMVSKSASPEAGQALEGSLEMMKSQVNAFTNLFTAPGIKSITEFFGAMADAPNQVLSFGEALLSVTKRLENVSPEFAAISAEQEIRQLERDIRTGEATGGSAGELSSSIEDLKDAMLPLQNEIYNETASLVTDLVPVVKDIYSILSPFIKSLLPVVADILRVLSSFIVPLLKAVLSIVELLLGLASWIASWLPDGNLPKLIIETAIAGGKSIVKDMTASLKDMQDENDVSELNTHKEIVRTLLSGSANRKPK